MLLPGIGPAKSSVIFDRLAGTDDALVALATSETMKLVPAKGKGQFAGFVADLRKIQATDPETHPAEAIEAILKGGYPQTVRSLLRGGPTRGSATLEQLVILAGKYESLERLLADLLLAGDIYGADTLATEEPEEHLVLSSIHQAKGLEWSKVFVIRLVEDGFPNARALNEPGGEEEERRIFYVAITRAMDELFLDVSRPPPARELVGGVPGEAEPVRHRGRPSG